MRYKRLYTFGCSFTKWYWPCWPEIIAHDTGLPFENWGASAAGNVGIANGIGLQVKENVAILYELRM